MEEEIAGLGIISLVCNSLSFIIRFIVVELNFDKSADIGNKTKIVPTVPGFHFRKIIIFAKTNDNNQ